MFSKSFRRAAQLIFVAVFYVGSVAAAYAVGYYQGFGEGHLEIDQDYRELFRDYRNSVTSDPQGNSQ